MIWLDSNNSPCSSGYATPQQTVLTDSMVDTLPWKSLTVKEELRNVMEDSTDTIVDDANKVTYFTSPSFDWKEIIRYYQIIHLIFYNIDEHFDAFLAIST